MTLLDKYFPVSDKNKTKTVNNFPTVSSQQPTSNAPLFDKYFPSKQVEVTPEKPKNNFSSKVVGIANEIGKFAARTGVEGINFGTSLIDISADILSTSISKLISQPKIGITGFGEPSPSAKKAADKWKSFYESGIGKGTEKLKTFTQELRNLEYIKPSEEWTNSSTTEKLTTKLPETVLNIGPGIVASIGSYAINPALGFVLSAGSVADEVTTIAETNGYSKEKSQALGLGTGLLVTMLDKIVPDELFTGNQKAEFVGGLAKRAAQYGLRVLKTGVKEATTEVLQEDIQILAESTVRNDLTKDEVKVRNIMAGLGGFLGGSGAQSVTSFINNIGNGNIAGLDEEVVKKDEKTKIAPEVKANKSLVGDEKAAQDFSIEYYSTKQDELTTNYLERVKKEFGTTNIVSADEAKYAIPDFNETKSRAYHEASSSFADKYAQKLLSDPKNEGKPVLLMAGGSGAGKTTVLRSFENFNDYALVYDSNMSSQDSSATKLIDQALSQGRSVDVDFVLRDPQVAFEGVLKRVKTRSRIVPVDIHVKNHIGSVETVKALNEKYGDKINIKVFENNTTLDRVVEVPIDTLNTLSYNKEALTNSLNARVDKAVANGEISPEQAKIFKPTGAEAPSGTQQADDSVVQKSSSQAETELTTDNTDLIAEARKYKSAEEFTRKITQENLTQILEDGRPQNFILSDVLDYPELYKRYPEAKNIPFVIKDTPGAGAYWDRTNKKLVIDPAAGGIDGFYENIIHELQHFVQQKEGMLPGGTQEGMSPEALKKYLNIPGEVQAREASKNKKLIFTSLYNQATKSSNKDVKPTKSTTEFKEKVIEEQVATTKDIKGVKRTLRAIRSELDTLVTEAQGKAVVATDAREGLDTESIAKLKRIYTTTKSFQEGDIETIRASKHKELVNSVVENIQEKYPDMSEAEAFDFALSLPTKSDEKGRTPEIIALEKKEKTLRGYLDQLKAKEKELDIKRDEALTKEWSDVVAAQEKLVNIVKIPESQLPIGTGDKKVSKLEARVKGMLDGASVEEKEKLGLSTYKQVNNKENIKMAEEYISKNPDKALKILKGEIEPPEGILRNAIYVAMKEMGSTDTELATKIASLEATRLGQELSILQEIDADSPVSMMESIVQARIEGYKRIRTKKATLEARVKSETNKVDQQIKAPDPKAWDSFLQSIAC